MTFAEGVSSTTVSPAATLGLSGITIARLNVEDLSLRVRHAGITWLRFRVR